MINSVKFIIKLNKPNPILLLKIVVRLLIRSTFDVYFLTLIAKNKQLIRPFHKLLWNYNCFVSFHFSLSHDKIVMGFVTYNIEKLVKVHISCVLIPFSKSFQMGNFILHFKFLKRYKMIKRSFFGNQENNDWEIFGFYCTSYDCT